MPMSVRDFIAGQLGRPRGFVGRLLLRVLNRANAGMNRAALRALALGGEDRLLDVGFGGGDLMAHALRTHRPALVAGVDFSAEAVRAARHRFRTAIGQGAVEIYEADAAALPFGDATFTAACTVNTVYFWPDPSAALAEMRRVLGRGGRIALVYAAAAPVGGAGGTRTYAPAEVEALLRQAGFSDARTEAHRDGANGAYFCTAAHAAASRTSITRWL